MKQRTLEAIETLAEISDRADALKIGIVKYPVEDVREVLSELRRRQMGVVHSTAAKEGGSDA